MSYYLRLRRAIPDGLRRDHYAAWLIDFAIYDIYIDRNDYFRHADTRFFESRYYLFTIIYDKIEMLDDITPVATMKLLVIVELKITKKEDVRGQDISFATFDLFSNLFTIRILLLTSLNDIEIRAFMM